MDNHSMSNASKDAQKKIAMPTKETPTQELARLKKENADLKAIAQSQPTIDPMDSKYMQDLAFFDKQKVGAGKIVMKDVTDHKNISLWTAWGKRIGPVHPHNAKFIYNKFRKLGRILFTQKPVEAEIQAYYKSPKHIAWKKKFDADRIRKNKSKNKGELDKILSVMSTMTGQSKEQLQSIVDKPIGV